MPYAAAAQSGGGSYMPLLLIFLVFIAMYFMMIRPQQKRRREAERMQSALGPGDEIVTIGGLHGTVVAVTDEVVTLEIASGVTARYARPAIARVLPSGQTTADDVPEESAAGPITDDRGVGSSVVDQSPVVETGKND